MRLVPLLAFCSLACSAGVGDPHARLCLAGWADYPEQAEAIQGAAEDWRQVTAGEVAFTFETADLESDCSRGSVPVVAEEPHGSVDCDAAHCSRVGHADPHRIWLWHSDPVMAVLARHELGHFVGIEEHSDDERDVMFEVGTPVQSSTLTMGDFALWLDARAEMSDLL